jgi:hypothetical protein
MRLIRTQDVQLRNIVVRAAQQAGRITAGLPSNKVGAIVRQAMYQQRRALLLQVASEMWDDVPAVINANIVDATKLATGANRRLLNILGKGVPGDERLLLTSMKQAAETAWLDLESRYINSVDLSYNVYKNEALMMGHIDDVVNNGILLGQSAAEIADGVVEYINPRVMGGQRYAAMRLGRTELNNAFHTTARSEYANSPYVTGVLWNLSGSHDRQDECDDWDGQVFEKEEVPDKPHPNCFCFVTPLTTTPEQFSDNLIGGDYDAYIGTSALLL